MMFRRKDGENEENDKKGEAPDTTPTIPLKPFSSKAGPSPHIGSRPSVFPSPGDQDALITHPSPHIPPAPRKPDYLAPIGATESRRLSVPSEVAISGEIVRCERLVIDGEFQGKAISVRGLLIGEHGIFRGEAAVDEAEVIGYFDGTLTVRGKLVIRTTGRVKGAVRYGRISIENGGVLSGDAQPIDEDGKA